MGPMKLLLRNTLPLSSTIAGHDIKNHSLSIYYVTQQYTHVCFGTSHLKGSHDK